MPDRDARHFAPDRHAAILHALDREGRAVSAELAARLGVSIDTVRRDLDELERSGALRRVHGGAVRPSPGARRFADRLAEDDDGKGVIAGLAVQLVRRGEVVAFGGGTTTLLLARALPLDLDATIITSSPAVALALSDHPSVDVDLLGGRVDRVSQTVAGVETIEQLRGLRPDACVISTCGVDPQAGVTLREREEALVVRAMLERAGRAIVLASAGKLASAAPYVVAPAARVDVLVTDAPRAGLGAYEALGIALLTPEAPPAEPAVALGA